MNTEADINRRVEKARTSRKGIFRFPSTLVGRPASGEKKFDGANPEDFGMGGEINSDYRTEATCPRMIIAKPGFIPIAVCKDGMSLNITRGSVECPPNCELRASLAVNNAGFLTPEGEARFKAR